MQAQKLLYKEKQYIEGIKLFFKYLWLKLQKNSEGIKMINKETVSNIIIDKKILGKIILIIMMNI
ncbi:hypothetical protein MHY_02050 [Megamonas hypermegale ART12/1]|nr:hypothetical protein MHY_02050 [Megamonas hypermegale ART12/1]